MKNNRNVLIIRRFQKAKKKAKLCPKIKQISINKWHKKNKIKIKTGKENRKLLIISTSFFFLLFR